MYHVIYDSPRGVIRYCKDAMDHATAQRLIALFASRYLNDDGTPKPYPNGKGHYAFTNPRIIPA